MANQFLDILKKPSEQSSPSVSPDGSFGNTQAAKDAFTKFTTPPPTTPKNAFLAIAKTNDSEVPLVKAAVSKVKEIGANVVEAVKNPRVLLTRLNNIAPGAVIKKQADGTYVQDPVQMEKALNVSAGFLGGADFVEQALTQNGKIPQALLNSLRKETNPEVISQKLQGYTLPKDVSDDLAQKLAPTKTVGEVKQVLVDFKPGATSKAAEETNPFLKTLKGDVAEPSPVVPEAPATPPEARADVLNPDTSTQSLSQNSPLASSIQTVEPTAIPEPKLAPTANTAPIQGIENDIPMQTAIDAHRGTSFDPEKRGQSRISDYVDTVTNHFNDLKKLATTPEKENIFNEMFQKFREGYKTRKIAMLNAESRTASPMVTGSARFPVDSNRVKLNVVQNKYKDLTDFEQKSIAKIRNTLNPKTFTGTSEKVIGEMGSKLDELKNTREKMKAANKIIRSGKDVENQLKNLGYDDKTVKLIVSGDYMGRKGFPSFELTSINNKIKTLENRVTETATKRELANTTGNEVHTIGDTDIIKNFDANRLQIDFKEKPSAEIIKTLKSKGFNWSPTNKMWQRTLTDQAEKDAKNILSSSEKPKSDTTVNTAPSEVPTPSNSTDLVAEAKKYSSVEDFLKAFTIGKNGVTSIKIDLPTNILEPNGPLWDFSPTKQKITEPILVVYNKSKGTYTVVDGHHRLSQALVNNQKILPSRLVFEDSNGNIDKLTKSQIIDIYNQAHPTATKIDSSLPSPKEVNQTIDQFITDGKIRVVSRDGRDIYQVKKGNQWMNTRSEESAVKQAGNVKTPSVPKETVVPPKTEAPVTKTTVPEEIAKGVQKLSNYPKIDEVIQDTKAAIESKKFNSSEDFVKSLSKDQIESIKNLDAYLEVVSDLEHFGQPKNTSLNEAFYNFIEDANSSLSEQLKDTPLVDTTTGEGRSLEITAQVAQQSAPSEFHGEKYSLPGIIQQTQTPVKKKINLLDIFRTPEKVLRKIGFGKEFDALREGYDGYIKELPKNIDRVTRWSKEAPGKESTKRIFQYLDGEAVDLTPKERGVVSEIKPWLKEWAVRLNLPKDKIITHYITHLFDVDSQMIKDKEFDEDLAKIIAEKLPGQVYDPFLLKRLGTKGYKQDVWAALDAYVKRATRKVHMDPALEMIQEKAGSSLEFSNIEASQWKYIQNYINSVNMRPTEFDEKVDNLVKSTWIGYKLGQRPTTYVLKLLRQMTFRGALGLNIGSALRNISQGVNTYATLGEKYTALGYSKLFNPANYKELEREGVLANDLIQDRTLSATKKVMEKVDKGLFAFFETAEKINRGAAYFGAKAKYIANATRVASKGVDVLNGSPEQIEKDAIKYAKDIVRKTQFSFSPIDTPVALQSDIVKTLTQFQGYTIKQIEFLGEMARNKNFAGLLRYAVGGLLFVYTIGKTFGMKPEDLIPSFRFDLPVALKLPIEIGKALFNTPDKYGKARDTKQKLTDIGNAGITSIPAGSQAKKTIQGIMATKSGGSFTPSGQLQFEVGTTPWQKIQADLFGKYAAPGAESYFDGLKKSATAEKQIKPIYDHIQELKATDEAAAITAYDELSDQEKDTYQTYKKTVTAQQTIAGKKAILPTFQSIRALKDSGKTDEAIAEYEKLSDDQKKYYQLVKKQLDSDQKASDGTMPKYSDGDTQTDRGLIHSVFTYAKAIKADPIVAFNRIFHNESIRRVDNGAVIINRNTTILGKTGQSGWSDKVKKERGAKSDEILDHTVPVELGGPDSEENVKLVPIAVWKSYSPIENYLGGLLRDGKISKKVAQEAIVKFKNGEISADDVRATYK